MRSPLQEEESLKIRHPMSSVNASESLKELQPPGDLIPHAFGCAASSHEYLYVNGRRVSCPQLSVFIQGIHSQACARLLSGARQRKPPKPTWVLLLTSPRSAFNITSYEPDGPVIELVDERQLIAGVNTALLAALEPPPSVEPEQWEGHHQSSLDYTFDRHREGFGGFPVRKKASGGGQDQERAHAVGSFVTSLSKAAPSREGAGAKSGERGAKHGPTSLQEFAYRPLAAGSSSASSVRKQESEEPLDKTRFSPKMQAPVRQDDIPCPSEGTASWTFAPAREPRQHRPPPNTPGKSSQLPEAASSRSDPGPSAFKAGRLHRANPSVPQRALAANHGPADGRRPGAPKSRDVGEKASGIDSQVFSPAERPTLAALLRSWKNPCIAYSKPITQLEEMVEVRSWRLCIPHSNFGGQGAGRGNGRSGVQSLGRSFGDLGIFLGEVIKKLYISQFDRKSEDAPANQPKVAGVC